jgi:hypothetical protein
MKLCLVDTGDQWELQKVYRFLQIITVSVKKLTENQYYFRNRLAQNCV